jgi:hypothetical protein
MKDRVAAKGQQRLEDYSCREKLDHLTIRNSQAPAAELSQDLLVTFLTKTKEAEGLEMCLKHFQTMRGAMRLKTSLLSDFSRTT